LASPGLQTAKSGESNGLISQEIDDNVRTLEYWRVACLSADREYWNDELEMIVQGEEMIFLFLYTIIPIFYFSITPWVRFYA
jgi:hypothetical protein